MPILLKARDIDASKYKSEEFAFTTLYVSNLD